MTRITGRTPSARRWTGRLAAVGLALFAQVAVVGVLRVAPADATTQSTWRTVSVGEEHTCAERDDAQFTLVCWGDNSRGELGFGTIHDRSSPSLPVPLPGSAGHWGQIGASDSYSCATWVVTGTEQHLYCWGANTFGNLGDGTTTDRRLPVELALGYRNWTGVSTGKFHACATQLDHSAWCWGDNGSGELGDGTKTNRTVPVKVAGGHSWASISASVSFTCGITTSGALWCWGHNAYGQLGVGTTSDHSKPTRVGTASDWVQVATGDWHTCARNSGGSIYCWGSNIWGNLGTGDTTERLTPTKIATVSGVTSWTSVTAGQAYTCALGTMGSIGSSWCWGLNDHGQLGNGTTANTKSPSRVSDNRSTTWTTIAAGFGYHSCAVKSDHTLWCWGHNDQGQLGIGTAGTTDSLVPVNVS
jgi:alpha-tubulin suppressor-like RCC1 family protein